jgi:hypothetical protein
MGSHYARYLTFALAVATAVSDAAYLVYLRNHHMVRSWSGANAILLGLFMLTWSVLILGRRNRWGVIAIAARWGAIAIAAIGVLNLVVGGLFFL